MELCERYNLVVHDIMTEEERLRRRIAELEALLEEALRQNQLKPVDNTTIWVDNTPPEDISDNEVMWVAPNSVDYNTTSGGQLQYTTTTSSDHTLSLISESMKRVGGR